MAGYIGSKAVNLSTTGADINGNANVDGTLDVTGNVDLNGGTIDGTVIGGTTPAAVTGTTVTGTSFVTTGDMTFGDNDKAIFGAGSDLQIYHTGSQSVIEDAGQGNLAILATDFYLNNSANTENMITALNNGAVRLFYDGATKLATTSTGIDVIGTVTADGLTVDGGILASGTNPFIRLVETDQTDKNAFIRNYDGLFSIGTENTAQTVRTQRLRIDHATGDISFYEDTGTTPKFFWDASAESLGIGTSSPAGKLNIQTSTSTNALTAADQGLRLSTSAASTSNTTHKASPYLSLRGGIWNGSVDTDRGFTAQTVGISGTNYGYRLAIGSNDTPNALNIIGNGGNVGIGTATPDAKLDVQGPNNGTQAIFAGSTGTSTRGLKISTALSGYQSNDIVVLDAQAAVSGTMVFSTTGAERLRIDASGNVLIGCTSVPSSSVFGAGFEEGSLGRNILKLSCSSTGAAATLYFINPNGVVGSVSTGGSSTSYNTTSDHRLKENITPVQGAADIVKAMRPVTYNFKADSTDWHDGFLAHELQELHPRAVVGEKDAMKDEEYEVTPAVEATYDDEGNELTPAVPAVMGTRSVPEYQGVDYSKLTPILTAALQEALNKIDALEARLTALEATP